ncbi:MAG TPA: diguanylate cyclase [Solirubrobacteraceae bacterium]|nr:diguanylate cyclase [Solirubrobacteraceae bacterium]
MTDQPPGAGSPGAEGRGGGASGATFTRSILDTAHEAFVSMDAAGRIIDWNGAAERAFGYTRDEVVGRELADTIVPERFRQAHREGLQRFLRTGEGEILGERAELSAVHRDGHEFPIEITISYTGVDTPTFHAFLHDISERRLSEQVLRAMQSVTTAMARAGTPEEALEALLERLGQDMGWDIGAFWAVADDGALDLVAGWAGRRVDASEFERLSRQLRLEPGAGLPGQALERREPLWIEDYAADPGMLRARAARTAGLHSAICVPATREGEVVGIIELFCTDLRLRDPAVVGALATVGGHIGELLGVLEERHALLRRLETLALTDQLTGLPNRRAWEDTLARELARAARDGLPVCVAVLDLDGFKRYNDELGHLAGDGLLSRAADAWRSELRGGDVLARYGGDEFAALIPGRALDTAIVVVERLRRAAPEGCTCSAGAAMWDGAESATDLFGRADAALYVAKQSGRNQLAAAS